MFLKISCEFECLSMQAGCKKSAELFGVLSLTKKFICCFKRRKLALF